MSGIEVKVFSTSRAAMLSLFADLQHKCDSSLVTLDPHSTW